MIGTIVIPTGLLVVMLLLPFLDRVLPRQFAHFVACGLCSPWSVGRHF